MFWEHDDWRDIDASELERVLAVLRESLQEHEAAALAPGLLPIAGARARRMAFYADQWMYELSARLSAGEAERFASARAYVLVGPVEATDRDPRGDMPHRRPSVLRDGIALAALPMHGTGDAGPGGIEGLDQVAGLDLRKPGGAPGFDPALVYDYLDFHLAFFEGGSGLVRGGAFGDARVVAERIDGDGMAAIDVEAVLLRDRGFDRCLLQLRQNPSFPSVVVAMPECVRIGVVPAGMPTFQVGRPGDCGMRMLLARLPRRLVGAAEFLGMLAHAAGQPAGSPLAVVGDLDVAGDVALRQVDASGPIRVRDVEFTGAVSLDGFRSEYGVEFVDCDFHRGLRAINSRLEGDFVLRGSRLRQQAAADADACLDLYGMRIAGDADFRAISVGGTMDVSHVQVRNLACTGADVDGDVLGSNLACGSDAIFVHATVGGIVMPRASLKRLLLGGACVRGGVDAHNSTIEVALSCDSFLEGGELRLCEIGGKVTLSGARIGVLQFNATQSDAPGCGIDMLGGSLRRLVVWSGADLPGAKLGYVLLDGVAGLEKVRMKDAKMLQGHVTLRGIDCTGAVEIDSRGMRELDLANSVIRQLRVSDPVPKLNLSGISVREWRLGDVPDDDDDAPAAQGAAVASAKPVASDEHEVDDAIRIFRCMSPLDRSVWVALETDLRNQGRPAEASRVYRAMKQEERSPRRHLLNPSRRALSWLSWLLYGHGTRVWPGMLLWAALCLLLVLVLRVPDNVKLSQGAMLQLGSQCNRVAATATSLPKCMSLDLLASRVGGPVPELTARRLDEAGAPSGYGERDALMLALHYAVPFIGFDDSEWTPVDGTPAVLAALILGANTLLLSFAAAFVTRRWLR
jgi:hypothetical protein